MNRDFGWLAIRRGGVWYRWCCVFNRDLSPSQLRNVEAYLGVEVFDQAPSSSRNFQSPRSHLYCTSASRNCSLKLLSTLDFVKQQTVTKNVKWVRVLVKPHQKPDRQYVTKLLRLSVSRCCTRWNEEPDAQRSELFTSLPGWLHQRVNWWCAAIIKLKRVVKTSQPATLIRRFVHFSRSLSHVS